MATIRLPGFEVAASTISWSLARAEVSEVASRSQAVLGRQLIKATPWLTERHGYDPTFIHLFAELVHVQSAVSRRPTGLRKTIN